MRKVFLFVIFLFFVFPATSLAAISFTVDEIIDNPKELPVEKELEVKVSFSGVSEEKQYYLFLVFRKPESGAYNFGFTQNNDDDWIKYGDEFDNFYKIEIKESSWSGILKVKPDYEANGFKGEGEYQVRAGRYVSGNSATWTESEDLRIFLKAPPTPTLTPTPTPEPTETPQPTDVPTPQPPSSTPVPTSTPRPTSTPKPTVTPKLSPTPTLSEYNLLASESAEEVLGIDISQAATESSVNQEKKKKFNFWPFVFIIPGLGMICFSVLLLRKQKI